MQTPDFIRKIVNNVIQLFKSNIKPFHEDTQLQTFILNAIDALQIRTFFETGTFRGDSICWVASKVARLKCYSVERNIIYYAYARARVKSDNVVLIHGNSADVLNAMLSHLDAPIMFWLDAHWDDFPLCRELKVIGKWKKEAVVIIDDFKHPFRSLGYDSYNGLTFRWRLLTSIFRGFPSSFPTIMHHVDTLFCSRT